MYILNEKKKLKGVCYFTLSEDWTIRVSSSTFNKYNLEDEVDVAGVCKSDFDLLYDNALNISLYYLGYKMRTEKEMKDYLYRKHFFTDVINAVIKRLKELKYIDDAEYIKNFTIARASSLDGKIKIKNDLIKKGIDDELINKYLNKNYKREAEIDNVYKLIEKSFNSSGSKFSNERKNKAINSAVRKGYSLDIINSVINDFDFKDKNELDIDKQRIKISQKARKLLAKEKDEKTAKYKLKAFFYAKGADSNLVEEVFESIINKNN